MTSTLISTLFNYFKPHRAEAISRIRTNSFWLVALLLVTYLLPTPFLLDFTRWNETEFSSYIWKIELAAGSLLSYNILTSAYAIKYPRQPLPPISPKKRSVGVSPTKGKRLSELVSTPPRTPERSRSNKGPFTPSSSLRPSYASPLRYTLPPSASTSTFASTSSLPPTPSPVVSAYRGRAQGASASVVRPIDGSFVEFMKPTDDDE